ncbi:hypothetical protein [Aureimonas sp. AU4]|uniref:hypothetical protein n=1 Tax=Aureimonas sp. AU4 TaxID=1638163 RepID=UPI0007063346|nr:hypothetical protein [Aureimonas sp. AU4]BAT30614.1 protein CBG08701 [Aureimonas sp. AU4]
MTSRQKPQTRTAKTARAAPKRAARAKTLARQNPAPTETPVGAEVQPLNTYTATLIVTAEQFGQDLFETTSDELVRLCTANLIWVGDLMTQLTLFRERGKLIEAHVRDKLPVQFTAGNRFAWATLAKERYRKGVQDLFTHILEDWRAGMMLGRQIIDDAIVNTVPLASMALVFPEDCPPAVALDPSQYDAMRQLFEILADIAGKPRGERSGSHYRFEIEPEAKRPPLSPANDVAGPATLQ